MTAEVWYGRKPETRAEQDALVDLYQCLHAQAEHFLILVQFHAGQTNEVDWVIVKPSGIFVVELKSLTNASCTLFGRGEGDWIIRDPVNQAERPLKNPFKQVKYNYWHFVDWCTQNKPAIAETQERADQLDFKSASRSYVIITPDLFAGSDIDVAPFVTVMGLPKFLTALWMVRSNDFNLTQNEIDRIPRLLQLEKWELAQSAGEDADEDKTRKLEADWAAEPFTGVIALGHNASIPILNFERLNKETITIGREPGNDLAIEDETVSRFHARIYQQDGWYVLEDMGSTSGTHVNFKGDPGNMESYLGKGMCNRLRNHSTLRFGAVRYMFLLKQ